MAKMNNIAGAFMIDANASFLNGFGLGAGEDKNSVIPKTLFQVIDGKKERLPYVSAQAWRRWLRDTANEENSWEASELKRISLSGRDTTNKVSTELDPIRYPEDDIFGYMRSGGKGDESIQRTSALKTSILKAIKNSSAFTTDNAYVYPKNGTPLPYFTQFYSAYLEAFFNLEYSRIGVFYNYPSKVELSTSRLDEYKDVLIESDVKTYDAAKSKKYELKEVDSIRKGRASGLLKALAFLRGGAKQAAFASDVSPKVLVFAALETANPIFNNIFEAKDGGVRLKVEVLKQLKSDYASKLCGDIYIGVREGALVNESELQDLGDGFVVASPVKAVEIFCDKHLK